MSNLGVRYQLGDGVPQDYSEALRLYRAASSKGNKAAPTIIGRMYEEGRGTKQDWQEAQRWYQLSVQRGDPWALRQLEDLRQKMRAQQQSSHPSQPESSSK